jgi:hypothetical protein
MMEDIVSQKYMNKIMGQCGFTLASSETFGEVGHRVFPDEMNNMSSIDQQYSSLHKYAIYIKQKKIHVPRVAAQTEK